MSIFFLFSDFTTSTFPDTSAASTAFRPDEFESPELFFAWQHCPAPKVDFPVERGNLTAVVVLTQLPELPTFLTFNRDFLVQGWSDSVIVLNDEGKTGNTTINGINLRYLEISAYIARLSPGFNLSCEVFGVNAFGISYREMCRFFWVEIWRVPELFEFRMIMRLDSDSRLGALNENPFEVMGNRTFFVAGEFWDRGWVIHNLPEFTRAWMKLRGVFPRNRRAFFEGMKGGGVKAYQTNFHITNVPRYLGMPGFLDFMLMVDFSWGIFTRRWGDAPLIYLAMALFAGPDQLMWKPQSWSYGHGHRQRFKRIASILSFFRPSQRFV